MYELSSRSLARLEGVHPDLVRVVKRAIMITMQDFSVSEGVRTREKQADYVAAGKSKTMASKHLRQDDGYSHAVDLLPFGRDPKDWRYYWPIAAAMQTAASEAGLVLTWGAVWDRRLGDLRAGMAGLPAEVEGYKARRKALKKSIFLDGPHFEIA